MKKKKRSKFNIFVLVICILLLAFVVYKYFNRPAQPVEPTPVPDTPKPVKTTYVNKIKNSSNVTIKEDWEKLIINYLDRYTKSLMTLESQNVKDLFANPEGLEANLTQTTIDYIVEHHKLEPNDYKMSDAKYDIEYVSVKKNDKVTIEFLLDSYYKYNLLDGMETKIYDVKHTIVIGDAIESLRVVQDNYVMFSNPNASSIKELSNLKTNYLNRAEKEIANNKKLLNVVNEKAYVSTKQCDNAYDREAAKLYATKYVDIRNKEYADYSNSGGNCANYGSQVIYAGGVPMDYTGAYQWKHYSSALNNSNTASGRSASWVSTNAFYDYAKNNTGYGLCATVDENLFYAEAGDIIQVGYSGYSHTVVVMDQYKKDDKIVDIIINSNTVGLENFPLNAYAYPNKRLIKVLGYNE